MRTREKRFGIAMLLWALVACDDPATTPQEEDETPTFEDDDAPTDESETDGSGETTDAGPRRDAGTRRDAGRDSGRATQDDEEDAGDEDEDDSVPDAGRPRDGGSPDAGAADASVGNDAAVPAGDHCAPTASWDPQWAAFEDEVLRLTNEARAKGASCGAEGSFPAAKPLAMEARLRCSARLYSEEMVRTSNFSHTSTDGTKFNERIAKTGYRGRLVGENIAAGYATPAKVMEGWMKSDGHCKNIMTAGFTQIGIGYYIKSGAQAHWTQNFGASQ